jgi:hypothetical protein
MRFARAQAPQISLRGERCGEKIENVVGLLLLLIKLYWDSYRNAQES